MEFLANKVFTHVENHITLDQNLITLKRKWEELNAVKEDNESKKSTELQQPRKRLKKEVEIWFRNVERINGEINDLENEVGGSSHLSRGFHGSNVLEKIKEVEELLKQGRSYDGLVIDDTQWIGQVLSTTNLVGEVAENLMKEIWAYLMDDVVPAIGVWGMGGMGKTTIMKLINNQLLQETGKFNTVMWITVSKELNIAKLQDDIACAMKESPLEDDDVTRRAGIICQKLSGKGKYVLILDDLWDNFSLEEVGIPKPTIGSKLVVTTRKLDVCRYLDCREVRVPTLPKQDALSLFLEKVGRDVLNNPDLPPIVESVVEQCAGLPLAIVTVASSMKGVRNIHEWRNALIELNRCAQSVNNFDEKVLQQLRFSYDRLKNERVKQCFLYCALWPEDSIIRTDNLIEFWIAEGLVEELESMEEETDRGHTILNKLVSNCLLEKVDGESCVKLHDLVRDMALDITTREKPRFLVRANMQLKEIPDLPEWAEDLEKVSLMINWEMKIPPQMPPPKCHALTTLLLSNCGIKSIPECFFKHMHGLKILDLSSNPIESLPNSISALETLTALLLWNCNGLENIPSLSKLQALKKLDLGFTRIRNLPHGMERLVRLKYLSLCGTRIEKVPDGILSKFSCLRHLVVCNEAAVEAENIQRFVRGDEIGGLRMLEIFCGRFRDLKELSNYVQALHGQTQEPHEYNIRVGDGKLFLPAEHDKCIKLNHCPIYRNGAKFPSNIQQLIIKECSFEFCEELLFSRFIPVPHGTFSALTSIKITSCKTIKTLFSSDWVLKNLQNLVVLNVWSCDEMEEIIASASELEEERMDTSNSLNLALPKLSKLSLSRLPKLKSIYSAKGAMVCDSLQTLLIYGCPKLKRIAPLSLQKIMIRQMESNSRNFSERLSEQFILVPHATFSALTSININGCKKIKKLFSSDWTLKNLQNLEILHVYDCDEMEEIIASASELEEDGMDSSNILDPALPKLRELSLAELPNLKSIYSAKGAMVCDSLETIRIERCPELKRISTLSLQKIMFPQMECNSRIFSDSLSEQFIPEPHATFSSLTSIKISGCKKIKKLFASDWTLKNLQSLEILHVYDCDEMEEIITSASELAEEGMDSSNTLNLALPKLSHLLLGKLPNLKNIFSAKGAMVCDSLQTVSIHGCPKLKRIPLYLPLLEGDQPSPPPSLQKIFISPMEWENKEWDHPYAKSLLKPFVE